MTSNNVLETEVLLPDDTRKCVIVLYCIALINIKNIVCYHFEECAYHLHNSSKTDIIINIM